MTSHYNVYFNGKEAFNSGLEKINKAVKEDYSRVLPVYNFSITQSSKSATSDMETALKKSHKLIELHSIKVKPKRHENPTPRQREMQLKEEYNPYVAEAYLLMGQANVVLHDEKEAFKILEFLHQKFPSEHAAYESLIWKSIAHAQIGQFASAKGALDSYDLDGLAPADLYFDYQRARANIHLELEQYAEAIPFLESAIKEGSSRADIRRLKFILAQVYREVGQPSKAAPLFYELSKSISDYDMAFAAKMELASVATTPEDMKTTEKTLRKMANDIKNEEYLDQIYYSLGKLQQTQSNNELANILYRKSVNHSKSNTHQKGLSYLAMADLAAIHTDYLKEGTYIDSAAQFLSITNPRKAKTQERASLLKPLTKELRIIHDNDSLMRIANMTEKERERYLDKIISKEKKKLESIEAQKAAEAEMGMTQSDFYRISTGSTRPGGQSSWYFYTSTLVQAGKSAFIQKWGQRPNEDNWRRADKSSATPFEGFQDDMIPPLQEEGVQPSNEEDNEKGNNLISKDKLIANLPLSAEAKESTNNATATALFKAATILYEDIHDYPTATKTFNELLTRYPNTTDRYNALTMLYFSASKTGDTKMSDIAASKIKHDFPDSEIASYLQKGASEYFTEANNRLESHESKYRRTYESYLMGEYAQSYSYATQALDQESEADYHSKYLLIRALSSAKQGQKAAFEVDLKNITSKYTHTPEDTLAQAFLALLNQGKMPVVHQDYKSPIKESRGKFTTDSILDVSKIMYEYKPNTPHSVVAIISKDMQNRAQFLIANYNFTSFILNDYDLAIITMGNGTPAIQISGFLNKQEAMQYFYSLREQSFFKEITESPIPIIYAIATEQIHILRIDKDLEYNTFFQEHYLRSFEEE